MIEPLLSVRDVSIAYGDRRAEHTVIKSVSFELGPGETLGLVGESGSGKTTIGRAILGLVPLRRGCLMFDGTDITNAGRAQRRALAGSIQVIFQDPYSSLNPSMSIEQILTEPLMSRRPGARAAVRTLLQRVGLPDDAGARYPAEFSGGQRQRIAVARALAMEPRLIVCDEPTSSLDVTTQERIIGLLQEIQQLTGVAYLFISHDLGVVREMSDRIAVLNSGTIVEEGPADRVALRPEHPYSKRLQLATPIADPDEQAVRRAKFAELVSETVDDPETK